MSEIIKLHLDSIAPGGDALGRQQGKPVFVEGGAPDETVLCRITEDRASWARAEILEIVEPSPVRVAPVCKFYAQCGGCNLQHIDYEAQLKIKIDILKDSLVRIGGFDESVLPDIKVHPSLAYEYRNRMQFHCIRDKDLHRITRMNTNKFNNDRNFGLKGRRSNEIIAVTDCPVAVPMIREVLQNNGEMPIPPEKDRFTVFAKDGLLLSEGGIQRGNISLLDKTITVDAGVFFQSNIAMLEKLILELQRIAREVTADLPNLGSMADLYCGVGTFAMFLCDYFDSAVLAEENKTAVALARENLINKKLEFYALRDTEWTNTFLRKKGNFNFMIVDPPRAGLLAKALTAIVQNKPPVLAYVSCDAAALARDAKRLTAGGYVIKELTIFDFYPQTAHLETLAVFR